MKFVALLFLVLSCAAHAHTISSLELFEQAMQAINQNQDMTELRQQLDDDFPLTSYLEYAEIERKLPNVDVAKVQDFRRHNPHSPLSSQLYGKALSQYAAVADWPAFLALAEQRPNSLNLRCSYVQALSSTQQSEKARQEVKELLSVAEALPKSCQTLLTKTHKQMLEQDEIILLMRQAYQHNQSAWLTTLTSWLPNKHPLRQWAPLLLKNPQHAQKIPNGKAYKDWYELALWKLASQNAEQALNFWQSNKAQKMLSAEAKQKLGARIAWFSSISRKQPNREWLNEWLNVHSTSMANTLEQRARYALREQDWQGALHWISLLPRKQQYSSQWLYWQARAFEQLGQEQQAQPLYIMAAGERSYYGFLAAEKAALKYPLNDAVTEYQQLSLTTEQTAALARIRLLLKANYFKEAQTEWTYLLSQVSLENKIALGRYAELKHWYNFTIVAAIQGQQWNHLSWRFPLAWQDEFEQAAETTATDKVFLMMAVARRESSFSPYAVSPAGARGLMQLMPATARLVAKQRNQKINLNDLFDRHTNIKLGTHYLADLLEKYQGNSVLALAAYNAGPHRVNNWLYESPVPFDLWIETIPFKETREYVQAVLTYRVIFMSRANHASEQLALLSNAEKAYSYAVLENQTAKKLALVENPSPTVR